MPKPRKEESKKDFISRAIKTFMKEGLSQKVAIGRAINFWEEYKFKKK